MPNWCNTSYVAVGGKEPLTRLENALREARKLNMSDFAEQWCGNVVKVLGGDPMKVWCRGWVDDFEMQQDGLSIWVMSAWAELGEWRAFIEKNFPGVKLYYQSDEPGCEYYTTNDDTGQYFPDQYVGGLAGEQWHAESLVRCCRIVEAATGVKCSTLDECNAATERLDEPYKIYEYQFTA